MRKILFRGKRTDNGEWVYGGLTWYSDVESIITVSFLENETYWVQTETVGEYMGEKDKNGVKIFEGDIVWCRAFASYNGIWEYEKRFVVEHGWSQSMWEMCMSDEVEVVGNIHDEVTE